MKAIKSILLGSLVLAGTLGASSSFATQWFVGGSANGTSTVGPGPTNVTFAGNNFPCTSTFTVQDVGGAASVIAASFSGSAVCKAIKATNLPWAISAPARGSSGGNPTWTATVSDVSVAALGFFTCSGSVAINVIGTNPTPTATNAHITGSLGVCGVSSGDLSTNPIITGT
ncbi:hypothetical protein ASG87_05150 [Frateuria sp. Soil773]|uniref:hypothetical protein n=1 Tax=Frateuria sp. Soil773 TaxID=1736407 RepID=UPI0006FF98EC|nr:hypothetical protein [Frateuria sp. Soil773]KRE88949.1 hypothetical protein ASG87_05150 [Frateuria sp. Soil773]